MACGCHERPVDRESAARDDGHTPVAPPGYTPRRAERTVLHQVVREHLETFLATTARADPTGLPAFLEQEFRGFLDCDVWSPGRRRRRPGWARTTLPIPFAPAARARAARATPRRPRRLHAPPPVARRHAPPDLYPSRTPGTPGGDNAPPAHQSADLSRRPGPARAVAAVGTERAHGCRAAPATIAGRHCADTARAATDRGQPPTCARLHSERYVRPKRR